MNRVKIEPSWKETLSAEFEKSYFLNLSKKIRNEYLTKIVYPPAPLVFRAFDLCPIEKIRVVIIGQDPYHGADQANGLSFAVNDGITIPPSLKNIYKEIKGDLGIDPIPSGDLSRWANQGVLLLNSVLTVLADTPASHKNLGWETFTDAVINALNKNRQNIVYMLWGRYANEKGLIVDRTKNLVLTSTHPSPFSATAFFGNHHFSRCNEYLKSKGVGEIDWR